MDDEYIHELGLSTHRCPPDNALFVTVPYKSLFVKQASKKPAKYVHLSQDIHDMLDRRQNMLVCEETWLSENDIKRSRQTYHSDLNASWSRHKTAVEAYHTKKKLDLNSSQRSDDSASILSNSSVERYFSSLQDLHRETSHPIGFEPVPEPDITETINDEDEAITNNCNEGGPSVFGTMHQERTIDSIGVEKFVENVTKGLSSPLSLNTRSSLEELGKLGLSLSELDRSEDIVPKMNTLVLPTATMPTIPLKQQNCATKAILCPDCEEHNNHDAHWCMACGCVLIGIEPTQVSDPSLLCHPCEPEPCPGKIKTNPCESKRVKKPSEVSEKSEIKNNSNDIDLIWDYQYTISPTSSFSSMKKSALAWEESSNFSHYLSKTVEPFVDHSHLHVDLTENSLDSEPQLHKEAKPVIQVEGLTSKMENIEEPTACWPVTSATQCTGSDSLQTKSFILNEQLAPEAGMLDTKSSEQIGHEDTILQQIIDSTDSLISLPKSAKRSDFSTELKETITNSKSTKPLSRNYDKNFINTRPQKSSAEPSKHKSNRKTNKSAGISRSSLLLNGSSYERKWPQSSSTISQVKSAENFACIKSASERIVLNHELKLPLETLNRRKPKKNRKFPLSSPLPDRLENTYCKYIQLTPRILKGELSIWQSLPDEILLHVFGFLKQSSLSFVSAACKLFHRVAQDKSLWRIIELTEKELSDKWLFQIGRHSPEKIIFSSCSGNAVTNRGVRDLFRQSYESLTSLEFPNTSGGALKGDNLLLHAMTRCQNLRCINAGNSCVRRVTLMQFVTDFKELESVCVDKCSGVDDEFVQTLLLHSASSLRFLSLGGCSSITSRSAELLSAANCQSLHHLSLQWCYKITDFALLKMFKSLPNLKELFLSGVKQLRDATVIQMVVYCPLLETVSLANCKHITDASLFEISKKLSNLRNLDVSSCYNVTDMGIQKIALCSSKLRSINISSTNSTISSADGLLAGCKYLKILKLNHCQKMLTEEITGFITKLSSSENNLRLLQVYGRRLPDGVLCYTSNHLPNLVIDSEQ